MLPSFSDMPKCAEKFNMLPDDKLFRKGVTNAFDKIRNHFSAPCASDKPRWIRIKAFPVHQIPRGARKIVFPWKVALVGPPEARQVPVRKFPFRTVKFISACG